MIIDKWDYRIFDVCKGAEELGKETHWPVNYNQEESLSYLWDIYNQPDMEALAYYVGGVFSGWAIVAKTKEFHTEPFGYIVKFYVMPTARGTMVARDMMKFITEWFDKNDCVVSFATPTANIGQNRVYVNLLKKFGYVYDGYSLTRIKETCQI